MINEQIKDKEIRLIGEHGEQLGVMPSKDAFKIAQDANLDLVKIAPNAEPPVCRIIDYSKFRYEQARKEKENKKKQKTTETKEIQLTPGIADNDLNTKAGQARKFITKGNKVKVALRFRGREMAHQQAGMEIILSFCQKLEDVAVVDKPPKMEGRNLVVILAEKK
ncbi:MAG: translation initiation factor IF-3 [Lachnospiraceae bacterium]|nr:translation initiation factor IF-3 [Lachnospiraceae bacterium]